MKAVVAAFNQEKALVGAFSVIVRTTGCGTDGSICGTNIYSTMHILYLLDNVVLVHILFCLSLLITADDKYIQIFVEAKSM